MPTNRKSSVAMELRKKAGLSQTAVAAALGLSENSVRNWETGKHAPRLYLWQVVKLVELYGCELTDLVTAFTPQPDENTVDSKDRSVLPKIPVAS